MKHLYLLLLASFLLAVAEHAEAQKTSLKYITPTGREVPAEQAHFLIVQEENEQGGGIRTRFLVKDSVKVNLTSYSDINGGKYGKGIKHGVYFEWYPDGKLKQEMYYQNDKMVGELRTWYKNGQLRTFRKFHNSAASDTVQTYYESGALRRLEVHANDKMISGKVFDESGNEIDFVPMEAMPEFPGGENTLVRWIGMHMKYPKTTRKAKAQGVVLVSFIVDRQGKINDAEVVSGFHPDADAEGLRVVNRMPTWKPGHLEGEPVPVRYTLPLRFSLPNN